MLYEDTSFCTQSKKKLVPILIFLQIKDNLRNNINVLVPVKSLSDILASYGESGKTISYLKVDIEGSELTAIGMNYSCLMEKIRQVLTYFL